MCKCENIEFGTYQRTVPMRTPQGKWVDIDICICQEIAELWYAGIITMGCCCGHNKKGVKGLGWIGVAPESVEKMRELDYEQFPYQQVFGNYAKCHFIAKSVE